MAYYGYDPSKYIKDYTWISRELNPIIAKFASQVPELIETNKIIKENKRFKEMSWDAANQYLDSLEDEKLTKVASAMGLDYNDAADAREKLRSMLPKYGEKSTNEEYANQMVNSFFVPFVTAARSEKGGGSLSWGDLITLKSGVLQDAIRKTAVGQQMTDEAEYNTNFARKFGPGGEVEATNELNNQSTLSLDKSRRDAEEQRGKQISVEVGEIMRGSKEPEDVWSNPQFDKFSKESKAEAYKIMNDKRTYELNARIADVRKQAAEDVKNKNLLPKIYDQTELEEKLRGVRKDIADFSLRLKSDNMKNAKGTPEYTNIEQAIEDAKIAERVYLGALKYLRANPTATKEQVNTAMSTSRNNIDPEDEQQFISDWTSNKYGSGWNPFALGKKDDLDRFKSAYRKRFGTDPQVEEIKNEKGEVVNYRIIPIQGNIQDVESVAGKSPPSPEVDSGITLKLGNQQQPENIVKITNDDTGKKLYASLPIGTVYIAPDGKQRIKK